MQCVYVMNTAQRIKEALSFTAGQPWEKSYNSSEFQSPDLQSELVELDECQRQF